MSAIKIGQSFMDVLVAPVSLFSRFSTVYRYGFSVMLEKIRRIIKKNTGRFVKLNFEIKNGPKGPFFYWLYWRIKLNALNHRSDALTQTNTHGGNTQCQIAVLHHS